MPAFGTIKAGLAGIPRQLRQNLGSLAGLNARSMKLTGGLRAVDAPAPAAHFDQLMRLPIATARLSRVAARLRWQLPRHSVLKRSGFHESETRQTAALWHLSLNAPKGGNGTRGPIRHFKRGFPQVSPSREP